MCNEVYSFPNHCPDNSYELKDNDGCGMMIKEESDLGKFTERVEHLHYFVFRL